MVGIIFTEVYRAGDIPQTCKVYALYNTAVTDIETGNNSFRYHSLSSSL